MAAQTIQGILFSSVGMIFYLFLLWALLDGKIMIAGNGHSRAKAPRLFWSEILLIELAGLIGACLYGVVAFIICLPGSDLTSLQVAQCKYHVGRGLEAFGRVSFDAMANEAGLLLVELIQPGWRIA